MRATLATDRLRLPYFASFSTLSADTLSGYAPAVPFRTSPVVAEDEWELRLDVEDHIAILSLDKPDKLNAWSWETSRQLGARADQIRFDERVRAVVLRANGRAFCSGAARGMREAGSPGRSKAEKVRNYYEGIRWVHERF